MQIGYNNDVEYRGKTFHIQTEDRGLEAAEIESQIFHAGAILDTSIVSYQKVLDETDDVDTRIAKIRAMMGANHKSLYRKLTKGAYNEFAGLDPLEDGTAIDAPDPEEFAPSQDRVPAQARQIEEGVLDPDEVSGLGGDVEHVDISKLKEKLKSGSQAASEVEEASPTMVASPEDLAAAVKSDVRRPVNNASGSFRLPTHAETGVTAFRGLEPTRDDLAVDGLVEEYLAS